MSQTLAFNYDGTSREATAIHQLFRREAPHSRQLFPKSCPVSGIDWGKENHADGRSCRGRRLGYRGRAMANRPSHPGCLIGLTMLIVFSLIATWTVYTGYTQNKAIARFTSDAPADLDLTYRDAEAVVALRHRVREFAKTVREGGQDSVSLTVEDLNDLIGHEDRLFDYRNLIKFTRIGREGVEARIAFPMQTLFQGGKLRYLNGTITFNPAIEEGQLMLTIADIQPDVGGEVPSGFFNFISGNVNLVAPFRDDARVGPVLEKIQSIARRDGRLTIEAR